MPRVIPAATILAAVTLAGCGSSSNNGGGTGSSKSASGSTGVSSTSSAYPSSNGAGSSGSGSGATSSTALITTKHGKLGTILAEGKKELTVYLFEADSRGASHCSASCASIWPPLLGHPKAADAAVQGKLGTIKRSDGKLQVTYNGHPLYTYVKDQDDGDAYGEGIKSFGAEWYALNPGGSKVDES